VHLIRDQEFEANFDDAPDRLPVHACGFDGDVSAATRRQAIGHFLEFSRTGPERSHFMRHATVGRESRTRSDRLWVHVQPAHRA
jgi:hypothetical protein